MRLRLFLPFVLSIFFLPISLVHAADPCPLAGQVRATTQQELDRMRAARLPEAMIVIGGCWNPNDPYVGQDAGQAKLELSQMWCPNHPTLACGKYRSSVEDLSGQFATCIVDFIKKYRQRDPGLCIVSAYRSTEHQRCICGDGGEACAAPGKSNHQGGIAVDFRARNYDDMHTAVRAYPGLRHLTLASDPYHVEADSSGKCGTGTGGPNTGPAQQSPLQSAMNAIRSLFSPPPPPPISTPINPVYDPTKYFSTSTPPTSSTFDTPSSTASTSRSVSDLIEAIAANPPPPPSSTATGTPIALNNSIGNVAGLQAGEKPRTAANGSLAVSSLTPNNTFTSQDLSRTPTQNILRGNTTFVLLEALRQTLIHLLSLLRPFGGIRRAPVPVRAKMAE